MLNLRRARVHLWLFATFFALIALVALIVWAVQIRQQRKTPHQMGLVPGDDLPEYTWEIGGVINCEGGGGPLGFTAPEWITVELRRGDIVKRIHPQLCGLFNVYSYSFQELKFPGARSSKPLDPPASVIVTVQLPDKARKSPYYKKVKRWEFIPRKYEVTGSTQSADFRLSKTPVNAKAVE